MSGIDRPLAILELDLLYIMADCKLQKLFLYEQSVEQSVHVIRV